MRQSVLAVWLFLFYAGVGQVALAAKDMKVIPNGTYFPFVLRSIAKKGEKSDVRSQPVVVDSFYMDQNLVTNQDYLRFIEKYPEWRRSKIPSLYADSHYLEDWSSDLKFASSKYGRRPVVHISWFAAKAYCESLHKTLPSTDQWEYALADQGRNKDRTKEEILAWYSKPNSGKLADVGSIKPNGLGLNDMVGLVWEWTLDFNSFLAGDELRESEDKESGLFCGGGSLGTLDASDYAAFMRYSFRASLKASYTTGNLGFRCAREK